MAKKRYKINYSEGDCFAVPLCDGGFALGVVARLDKKKGVLGYFFAPKYASVDEIVITPDIIPEKTIHVKNFGDLGLVTCEWKIIGKINPWIREDWQIPVYSFTEPLLLNWGELRYYTEKQLCVCSFHKRVSIEEANNYPKDSFAGSGAIEIYLNKLLRDGNVPPPIKIVPVPTFEN